MLSKRPEQREAAFQLAWCALHLAGAAMNFGSFIYHMRRVRTKKKVESEDPTLYASHWYKT